MCVLCQVTDAAVKAFVEERPGMTFVGLLATDAGFSDFLNGEGILKVGLAVFLLSVSVFVEEAAILTENYAMYVSSVCGR